MEGRNITQKLLYVQQNLKAPKNQYNKFGEYHYRSCEDIQEALKPLLAEVKAVLLLSDELQQIGERFYIKASAIFQDAESSEKIINVAYARECDSKPKMDTAQITGSCSSYARKYALNGLFCIDDAKDPDTMDNRAEESGRSQKTAAGGQRGTASGNAGKVYVTQAHINTLRTQIARTGAKEAAVCYRYKLQSLQEMTIQQFQAAMKIFQQMPDKAPEENYQMTLDGIEQYNEEMPFR
nr:MAG TPA: ERF superfamily protein [Caudoviricetes sp.]